MMTKRQVEYKKEIRKIVSAKKIRERIHELGDWRAEMLSSVRVLMKQADPEVVEEVKWIKPTNPLGTVIWSHYGSICTFEVYKNHVKMTFSRGASLDDPNGLFNSSLDARVWRAIDFHEGDKVNERALKNLVRSAIALNSAALKKRASKT
jgi:hypothetical protein